MALLGHLPDNIMKSTKETNKRAHEICSLPHADLIPETMRSGPQELTVPPPTPITVPASWSHMGSKPLSVQMSACC